MKASDNCWWPETRYQFTWDSLFRKNFSDNSSVSHIVFHETDRLSLIALASIRSSRLSNIMSTLFSKNSASPEYTRLSVLYKIPHAGIDRNAGKKSSDRFF